jgi:hypothetical protein
MQVMETRKTVLGAVHPDTLTSMANLAHTWRDQGKSVEAIRLMDECVQLRMRILGSGHPHTRSPSETLRGWRMDEC